MNKLIKKRRFAYDGDNDNDSDSDNDMIKHDIYRVKNKVFFNTSVTQHTAGRLVKLLTEADLEIQNAIKKFNIKNNNSNEHHDLIKIEINPVPIELYLTTHGGMLHAAWGIVDTIHNLETPVHTIVDGYVASAGTLISLAGSKRLMGKNAYMLIHEVRSSCWGKFSEIRDDFENNQKLMDHIISYYKANTKFSELELQDILRRDLNLDANMCEEKGLIDEIRQ